MTVLVREKIREKMATNGNTTARQNEENDEHVLKRLVSQGNELKANRIDALAICHAGRDEMIQMQRIAAEMILQSIDAEFHTCHTLTVALSICKEQCIHWF